MIDDHKHAVATDEAADLVPPVQDHAVSRAGDLWILGDHKLLCADAREPSAYDVLLERKARLCFTDPPYNVKIDGHVCGLGSVRHGEFAMASGEMTHGEFAGFLQSIFRNMVAPLRRVGVAQAMPHQGPQQNRKLDPRDRSGSCSPPRTASPPA